MAVTYDDIYNEEYNKAVGTSVTDLENAQKEAEDATTKTYNSNKAKLLKNKNKALKEAYISKMKEIRDMPATLARQGLGGGMSETTQASITRNYQNNRSSAEENYQDNKTTLDNQYSGDIADIKANFASAITTAKNNAISIALASAAQRYNAITAEEAAAAATTTASSPDSSDPDDNNNKKTYTNMSGNVNDNTVDNSKTKSDSKYTYYYNKYGVLVRQVPKTTKQNRTVYGTEYF